VVINEIHFRIGLLSSVSDEGTLSIDIKLKDDHKKFTFGESKVGGGIKERYVINPKVFYYSPETSINFIGDFNNTGQSSSSLGLYNSLNSAYTSLSPSRNSFNVGSGTGRSLQNGKLAYFQKTLSGATNVNYSLAEYWRMHVNAFVKQGETQTKRTLFNEYLGANKTSEHREYEKENNLFNVGGNVNLKYDNLNNTEMLIDFMFKHYDDNGLDFTHSHSEEEAHYFNTFSNPGATILDNTISWNKRFDYYHLLTIKTNFRYAKQTNSHRWRFDQPIFDQLLPFRPQEENYRLHNSLTTITRRLRANIKLYKILNRTNHLYPEVGINYINTDFNTRVSQQLENGEMVSFHEAGFDNALDFRLADVFAGLTYKFMVGKLMTHAGAFAHYYAWKALQFGALTVKRDKAVVLPFLKAEYNFNKSEKLSFQYQMHSSFAQPNNFANRLRLMQFNSIYRGNTALDNTNENSFSLRYEKSSFYSGWSYNAKLRYRHKSKSFSNKSLLTGINYVSTTIMSDLPEERYNFNLGVLKSINDFQFSFHGRASYADYKQNINNTILNYNSAAYGYDFKVEYNTKDKLSLKLQFEQSFSKFTGNDYTTRFVQFAPACDIDYRFLTDFVINIDYELTHYVNKTLAKTKTFGLGKASLFYKQQNKPWGIELIVKNIADVRYKRNHFANTFRVSDSKLYLQPRTILLCLTYKL